MNPTRWQGAAAGAVMAASLAFAGTPAKAQGATQSELAARLDKLAAELAAVKAELARLQQQQASAPSAAAASAPAVAAAPPVVAQGLGLGGEPPTVLTSYGELNYNRPTHDAKNAVADVRRFVLGFQHRFDEKTKVAAELEVEHAVSSADDPGEVEVEQAYVERQIGNGVALRAGLFLMPVGLLNENHEPTAFYGVERNFVETAIIPSTWREGGVQLVVGFDNGLTAQAGITTSFDLGKWDASSGEGAQSPLGPIHQEMALAKARDLSLFGA
ncbi:MAG: porin, partial [Caldimonas sp.]